MRSIGPLESLEQWDDSVKARYDPTRTKEDFRQYTDTTPPVVREFYRLNHTHQTVDFVRRKKAEYLPLARRSMGIWEAMEFLNTLVDDSDPDTDLSQIDHAVQTAEAARRDGKPHWFVLTGLIHDLGKVLCLYGEPQWAVVGDTFPVGCAWAESIVYREYFANNPDRNVPEYQTPNGIYAENGGLDQVDLSWGHDEYLYHVTRKYLPVEAQYMIRYHSFYPGHKHGDYAHLMNERDREMFRWVREFNPYDLYSKSADRPDMAKLKPYYDDLIKEFFPPVIDW
jgi:inositol oxygenase